jgi:hypothetical protein
MLGTLIKTPDNFWQIEYKEVYKLDRRKTKEVVKRIPLKEGDEDGFITGKRVSFTIIPIHCDRCPGGFTYYAILNK